VRARIVGLFALALVLLVVVLLIPPTAERRARPPEELPDATAPAESPSADPPSSAEPPRGPRDDSELDYDIDALPIPEQREAMLRKMAFSLRLDAAAVERVGAIMKSSDWMSQGNPKVSQRAMTRAECRERRRARGRLPEPDARCGAANMVLLRGSDPSQASTLSCIDQYEFPNVPCEYPVVWVRADEANALCRALDKRLCDAHEWEGACAGAVKDPRTEYRWGERRVEMEHFHNLEREIVWAYGPEQNHALCATGSRKSAKCHAGGFTLCGTNDYPAGSFPECVSPLGVYDQHGNVAEHMSLPMKHGELGSLGGSGVTEMKGSWFIFRQSPAHQDDCRFRAPGWHASKITDPNSHRNYHLGFRCCRDVPTSSETAR
jgi:formylglycine-generating enzyme required for sulfatase activity